MKTLAKYHVCNHCVIGEKTFKNILIGPGKLPGLSTNGPQVYPTQKYYFRVLQRNLKLDCICNNLTLIFSRVGVSFNRLTEEK